MPEITVGFLGPVRRPWPEQKRTLVLPEGCTLSSLLETLGFSETDRLRLTFVVNGARANDLAARLVDGDLVEVALLVGGG